ncbi:MAG: hypothetical protein NTY90_04180, partial [Candidatus Micrarchaeota archaeon]|nr:hypothetical protein [Candidatus Micrarchaeota archaeon]
AMTVGDFEFQLYKFSAGDVRMEIRSDDSDKPSREIIASTSIPSEKISYYGAGNPFVNASLEQSIYLEAGKKYWMVLSSSGQYAWGSGAYRGYVNSKSSIDGGATWISQAASVYLKIYSSPLCYPPGLSVDVGNDGSVEWSASRPVVDVETPNLADAVNAYASGRNKVGDVSIPIHATSTGSINLSGFDLHYVIRPEAPANATAVPTPTPRPVTVMPLTTLPPNPFVPKSGNSACTFEIGSLANGSGITVGNSLVLERAIILPYSMSVNSMEIYLAKTSASGEMIAEIRQDGTSYGSSGAAIASLAIPNSAIPSSAAGTIVKVVLPEPVGLEAGKRYWVAVKSTGGEFMWIGGAPSPRDKQYPCDHIRLFTNDQWNYYCTYPYVKIYSDYSCDAIARSCSSDADCGAQKVNLSCEGEYKAVRTMNYFRCVNPRTSASACVPATDRKEKPCQQACVNGFCATLISLGNGKKIKVPLPWTWLPADFRIQSGSTANATEASVQKSIAASGETAAEETDPASTGVSPTAWPAVSQVVVREDAPDSGGRQLVPGTSSSPWVRKPESVRRGFS